MWEAEQSKAKESDMQTDKFLNCEQMCPQSSFKNQQFLIHNNNNNVIQ